MAALPVLTAVSDPTWESVLVSAFERRELGVVVVRRCVDLADLLAAASTGSARAVLLSADLRRLDRDALARLAAAGLAVVGLAPPGDEDAERRLRQLGIAQVLAADAGPDLVGATLVQAVGALRTPSPYDGPGGVTLSSLGDPAAALPVGTRPGEPGRATLGAGDQAAGAETEPPARAPGRVVAIWGPTGAPGRTTVAVALASEAAELGVSTLLVDADSYGGAVAQLLGLLEEAPGLAAAARAANNGQLDVRSLAGFCRELSPALRVLPGVVRPERWPELRPTAVGRVLEVARQLADLVIVDCGFCLEMDEEIVFDTAAPRRNGATIEALESADLVLAVGSADPVGLARLVRGLASLADAVPDAAPQIVLNRLRKGVVPGDPAVEVTAALQRHAGLAPVCLVPHDPVGVDAAVGAGLPLAAAAPSSPARRQLAALAASVVGASGSTDGISVEVGSRRRRRGGRQRASASAG